MLIIPNVMLLPLTNFNNKKIAIGNLRNSTVRMTQLPSSNRKTHRDGYYTEKYEKDIKKSHKHYNTYKNSEMQVYWYHQSLKTRSQFPDIGNLENEIQDILSLPKSNWETITTKENTHIFKANFSGSEYLKITIQVNDDYFLLGNIQLNDQCYKYWSPNLIEFETMHYSRDEFGVYEALYENKIKDQTYYLSDRYISTLWEDPNSLFIIKSSIKEEQSQFSDFADYKLRTPWEVIKQDRVDINKKYESCVLTYYIKIQSFPKIVNKDKIAPSLEESLVHKHLIKKLGKLFLGVTIRVFWLIEGRKQSDLLGVFPERAS